MGKRRPYMILGSLLSVPALMWMASLQGTKSILLLMLGFCMIQFWVNIAISPYQALMPDLVPKERQGTASAYLGLSTLTGTLGGALVCGPVIGLRGGLWIIMAANSLLLVGMTAYTVLRVPEHSAAGNPAPSLSLARTVIESFRVSPRQYPDFFRLIASRFVYNTGFYTVTEFLNYYIQDTLQMGESLADSLTAILIGVAVFSGIFGNWPAGILSDRMSKKHVIYASCGLTGIAALVFLLTSSWPVALGASVVFGMGWGAFCAVDWAFATNLLPGRDEAKYMGVWHVAFTVPQVVAPLIGGLIASHFRHTVGADFAYRVVFFTVIVYLAVGTVIIRPIRERVLGKR